MKNNYYMFFDSSQNCDGNLFICDNTSFTKNGFLKEDDLSENRYKLSEVIIFTILQYNSSTEKEIISYEFKEFDSETIIKYKYNYTSILEKNLIQIKKDGYYTLFYFAVPKKIKFKMQYNYYCDNTGKIFNEENEEVSLSEINFCYSNIMQGVVNHFFTNNMRNEFLTQAFNKMFNNTNGLLSIAKQNCCPDKTVNTIEQSILGSALAAIRYLIEDCKYDEAQLIVEQLSKCAGLYKNDCNTKLVTNDCGCNG